MLSKTTQFMPFSRAIQSTSTCYRPDKEADIKTLFSQSRNLLTRGSGLSYNDSCLNDGGGIIDSTRLNHLLSFDKASGLLTCQPAVTFSDLLLVDKDYIPPVMPGTLHATIAGGIAHDVHGKNNPHEGTFGKHIEWLELQLGDDILLCHRTHHADLFEATIAGMGLTGMIRRVGLRLKKASHTVKVQTEIHTDLSALFHRMEEASHSSEYLASWINLTHPNQALLYLANHVHQKTQDKTRHLSIPNLPIKLVSSWGIKLFNQYFFKKAQEGSCLKSINQFNNPLDSVTGWNHLYGKKGLIQCQAVFPVDSAFDTLEEIKRLIQKHQATHTLCVLKYFKQAGEGLLSFAEPGFTLAIDFMNNAPSTAAVKSINEFISSIQGKVYLAKDLLLTKEQFNQQYTRHEEFKQILEKYHCTMQSGLSRRLGLTL